MICICICKCKLPTLFTDFGIIINGITTPLNALLPILVRESGKKYILILSKNALLLILVNLGPNVVSECYFTKHTFHMYQHCF